MILLCCSHAIKRKLRYDHDVNSWEWCASSQCECMVNNGQHTGVHRSVPTQKACWHYMKICPTTAGKHICLFNSWKMERKQTSPPNKHTFYSVLKYRFEWRVYSAFAVVTCLLVPFSSFFVLLHFGVAVTLSQLVSSCMETDILLIWPQNKHFLSIESLCLSIYGFTEWYLLRWKCNLNNQIRISRSKAFHFYK